MIKNIILIVILLNIALSLPKRDEESKPIKKMTLSQWGNYDY